MLLQWGGGSPQLFITTTIREKSSRSQHKGATVGFELATNGIQFYAIVNLDKTSLSNNGPLLHWIMLIIDLLLQ